MMSTSAGARRRLACFTSCTGCLAWSAESLCISWSSLASRGWQVSCLGCGSRLWLLRRRLVGRVCEVGWRLYPGGMFVAGFGVLYGYARSCLFCLEGTFPSSMDLSSQMIVVAVTVWRFCYRSSGHIFSYDT
ncbi:hypothetical protein N658DRAFT_203696 [Parathielavia hyrcaniae]|uniref:Uncharacterized protein n=1 Tax=Parathielavia hyrcaniae TaxID=113614 RepID=A0AAN6SZY7_9PEZI|nr:hypothetical protein N658DRAFT_203696 [Parathielavia hyrcaniae]